MSHAWAIGVGVEMAGLPPGAFVDDAKLAGYLLDVNHKDGGPKAGVLLGYGFSQGQPDLLRRALLQIAESGEATEVHGATGIKYIVDGSCVAPDGRTLHLRTVWHALRAGDPPRLVTAYPRKP